MKDYVAAGGVKRSSRLSGPSVPTALRVACTRLIRHRGNADVVRQDLLAEKGVTVQDTPELLGNTTEPIHRGSCGYRRAARRLSAGLTIRAKHYARIGGALLGIIYVRMCTHSTHTAR